MLISALIKSLKYSAIITFCLSYASIAQELNLSKSTKFPFDLSSGVSLFADPTAKLSFEEVKKKTFTKNNKNYVILPFSDQASWLKIDLKNESNKDSVFYFFLENHLIRRISLFDEIESDSLVFEPFKDKKFNSLRYPHLPLKLKLNQRKTFYLKFETIRGGYFKLLIEDHKGINKQDKSNLLRLGVTAGLSWMVLFVFCIIGFLVIKDNKSRAYAIYTIVRVLVFWSTIGVLGSLISSDALTSEKITFALMSISPIITAFLSLNILPFGNLPKGIKFSTIGFMAVNFILLLMLVLFYSPLIIKLSVVLNLLSIIFFFLLILYTLLTKINKYPYYATPFLLGNMGTFFVNLRVLGILIIENIFLITVLSVLFELAVYVFYLSQNFRASVKVQAEKLQNLSFEAEKATKLAELDKLKTRFFTNISHEFRTPLTLLVGPIDDLKKKFPQEGIIDAMQRNLQRLQTLINQLLDLSKLEAGEMKSQVEELDMSNFFNQLFASFESLAQNKQIIFNHSLSHTFQPALFDADKLEKIIMNLLSNAFKFTPENGRINVRVDYKSQAESGVTPQSKNKYSTKRPAPPSGAGGLCISVQDTGIGIGPERLPHVFDRFYQVEEHNNHEGTGIGLALVKELVDLLSGTIEVKSEKGLGTTFNLVLPFTPLEKLSKPTQQMDKEIQLSESYRNENTTVDTPIEAEGQSIMLIIEDNPDLRNYIASIFEQEYQLILAIDGEDGLAKALEFIPDIVISDLMMPKLDGLAFCEKLKTDERTNHIPVVMLTAKASLSDRLIGLERGADDYLSKPFNREELQLRVKNLVSQRAMLFEKYASQKIEEIKEPTVEERFVLKCQSVIDKHLDKSEFDVEKFAEEMNLSPVQFRRKLKAISNQTVTEFVRNYRLETAANMLKNTNFTVSEIAFKVGFESLPYFSKVFQEKFGKTASEWK